MSIVKSIRIQNFKSLEDVTIDLSQLTLLFGANSSGKSSFLKALMFLSKNFYPFEKHEINYRISEDFHLGDYKQIALGHNEKLRIEFDMKLEGEIRFPNISSDVLEDNVACNLAFSELLDNFSALKKGYYNKSNWENISYRANYILQFEKSILRSLTIKEENTQSEIKMNYSVISKDYSIDFNFRNGDVSELFAYHWNRADPITRYYNMNYVLSDGFNKHFEPHTFSTSIISKDWLEMNDKTKATEFLKMLRFGYTVYHSIVNGLKYFFEMLHLGITREVPESDILCADGKIPGKIYYGFPMLLHTILDKDTFVEQSADNFQYIVSRASDKGLSQRILYEKFGPDPGVDFGILSDGISSSIYYFVNYHLIKLGFDLIYTTRFKERVFEFKLMNRNGDEISFNNASSGLIQIFPVLVACGILRQSNHQYYPYTTCSQFDTLILEQPELHLHPQLQSKLAKLFSDTVNCMPDYYTLFIETHSEHLIRKLQVLIAKGELAREKVGVWYFKKVNGVTKVEKMEIDENGLFKNDWPDGFFDDSIELTMELFEAVRKRKN